VKPTLFSRSECTPLTIFLIVGAGFSGAVVAERLARVSGKRCLVIDRRNHIAGNAFGRYGRHSEDV